MLLILSVLFLIYNIKYLRNGGFFTSTMNNVLIEETQFKIDKLEGKEFDKEKQVKNAVTVVLIALFVFGMLFIELDVFANLWDYDTLRYPTLTCIVLTLIPLAMMSKTPKDDDKDGLIAYKVKLVDRANKQPIRTKLGILSAVVHVCYYSYMIYTLCAI